MIKAPARNPKNLGILYLLTENSSIMTSEAEIYRKVPADIARKTASKRRLIPLKITPKIMPKEVVRENKIINTINTSFSILDLFRFIP